MGSAAERPDPPAERPPTPGPTTWTGELRRRLHLGRRSGGTGPIDPRRYRQVRRFIAGVFLQAIWWDVLLNRRPLRWARRDPLPRWAAVARRYRALAVEMGGVLIKLGQFLSIRVDLLPIEVTRELAGLQDEVPPAPFDDILGQVEADFDRSLVGVFAEILPEPVGAASLAQVHRALLTTGDEVVVKVLRPGIEVLVETDLAAAALATRWLKVSKRVRRRVDLDRLAEEFQRTTRRELDLAAEAESLRRFGELFADDPAVRVPRVYPEASGPRTLALEDVGFIKITERERLLDAGIDPARVAKTLYRLYMEQIFVHDFLHADPHPGNLFVEPRPTAEEAAAGRTAFAPGETAPCAPDRPFRIAFVDFGMTATIPPRLRGALREYLIGLGSRDAGRVVQAYVAGGVLLPGADLRRIEELHEALFDRFWGVRLGQMRDVALSEARYFLHEYRDLLVTVPFQVQVDLLFATRAVGILSGLTTSLDADFDPWAETIPFAERIAAGQLDRGWREALTELARQLRTALALPAHLEAVLHRAERGTLTVQTALAPEARRSLERLDHTGRRLSWTVAAAALLTAGTLLDLGAPGDPLGPIFLVLAAVSFLWGTLRHR